MLRLVVSLGMVSALARFNLIYQRTLTVSCMFVGVTSRLEFNALFLNLAPMFCLNSSKDLHKLAIAKHS